jgi:hypothetical protein
MRSRNDGTCRMQLPWMVLVLVIAITIASNGISVQSFQVRVLYSTTSRRQHGSLSSAFITPMSSSLIVPTEQQQYQQQYDTTTTPTGSTGQQNSSLCLQMSKREYIRQHIWIKGQQKFHTFRHQIKNKITSWRERNIDNKEMDSNNKNVDKVPTSFVVDGRIHLRQPLDVAITQIDVLESYNNDNNNHKDDAYNKNKLQLATSSYQTKLNNNREKEERVEFNESSSEVVARSGTLSTAVVTERRPEIVTVFDSSQCIEPIDVDSNNNKNIVQPRRLDDDGRYDYLSVTRKPIVDISTVPTRPVRDRSQFTPIEIEFDNMIGELYFSKEDIASIGNVRVRAILEGIIASDNEPAVYRAFQVLFQDLYPLRVAGRLIFKTLKELTTKSALQQKYDVELVSIKTGLDPNQIQDLRQMFIGVASKLNGDMYLTKHQLATEAIFLTDVATDVMGLNNIQELFDYLFDNENNTNNNDLSTNDNLQQQLTFPQLMIGLQSGIVDTCGLDQCDPQVVFEQLLIEIHERMPLPQSFQLSNDSIKYNDRYNEMVYQFRQWQHLIPQTGTGRRLDVVRGCFVGADNSKVVEALRTVYVDYAAFRFAGDVIFNLVSSVLRMRGAKM